MEHSFQASASLKRRREIDFMRALLVLGLIFFHTARIFDTGNFYVKNDPTSVLVTLLVFFASLWGMPLLFLISGIGIWYSLRRRTPGIFIRERFLRLFIPLVFGTLVVVPPQQYCSVLFFKPTSHLTDTYLTFLSGFFDVRCTFDFPNFITGVLPFKLFQTAHLWFLNYLFFFSLLLLPLIIFLRRPAGQRLVERLAAFCMHPGAIFLPTIPPGAQ